ncbi:RNA processing factor, putative [Theileria annulata]|uniref:RNA processing factor, putative n=1 Tax=Theileria annulata TaxID=5874 RepID=Q4UC41_THEAN|nr:RNA processing factor, putative [Theileria annulata]CAI75610.1 RNA processing factor, putative [Theileria annulata]|eukprot:XP_955086.1 RNA processing factor, putative [Theileria annulata]
MKKDSEKKKSVKAVKNEKKRERQRIRGLDPKVGRKGKKMEKVLELRTQKKKQKRIERRKRKEDEIRGIPVIRKTPHTIESLRRFDETIVDPEDVEVKFEEQIDEFSDHFSRNITPKLLITSTRRPSEKMRTYMKELLLVLSNSFYFAREEYKLKEVVKHAKENGFTSILLVTQGSNKLPNGLYICSLPRGPTTFFKLTSLKLASEMKGAGVLVATKPEIVLNSFNTRLGRRIGRQIASLFSLDPEFEGRRVITFHNQRDMIFFRHHR